jgi:hypothetical protein
MFVHLGDSALCLVCQAATCLLLWLLIHVHTHNGILRLRKAWLDTESSAQLN